MGKTITICFTNNKGGSGKTTTCSNLGAAMAQAGKQVLLIDGDMQLNLSLAFFPENWVLEQAKGEKNLYCAIGKQEELSGYVVHTPYENLDLIPSSTLMSSIEYELFTKWQREFILRKCIQKIKDAGNYDYILIDAPPTLGGWVMNILKFMQCFHCLFIITLSCIYLCHCNSGNFQFRSNLLYFIKKFKHIRKSEHSPWTCLNRNNYPV